MGFNMRMPPQIKKSMLLGIVFALALTGFTIAQPSQTDSILDSASRFVVQSESDSIAVDGLIIDNESGAFPSQSAVTVYVDSLKFLPDTTGSFNARILRSNYHVVKVQANGFAPFAATIQTSLEKNNYFVTCGLEKTNIATLIPAAKETTIGPGWTISGCIADSRLDLAIASDSARLEFDNQQVPLSKKGSFRVITKNGGTHTFHVSIPGYHETYQNVRLSSKDPQPFVVVHTTRLKFAVSRREITVSAKRQPVHVTSSVAETKIPRNELKGTAATTSDPMQVLATLPSVATESDVSARPIVRGGDVLESRVFLDGITLLQPYHYGGIRSTFNQSALSGLTLYKSGFPAQYPNAQSALVAASSRMPAEEPLALDFDVNMMQYGTYLGIPIGKNKNVGVCASAQGSYMDLMSKAIMKGISLVSGDPAMKSGVDEYINTVNLPDYRDYSVGIEVKPNDKLSLFVNEVYNTDRVKFTSRDSMETWMYHYPDGSTRTGRRTFPVNPNFYFGNGQTWEFPGPGYDSSWLTGKKEIVDTLVTYKSRYNNLYGTAQYLLADDQVLFFSAAWQKRWWDLTFPRAFSDMIPISIYDVTIDQFNASGHWLSTGTPRHIIKAGMNLDYTKAKFNVYTARILHQLITEGSTNFDDHWGPVTGDTGFTLTNDRTQSFDFTSLASRLLVRYNGYRHFLSGGIFGQDEWSVTPRLTLDYGARIEASLADTSFTFSPRVSAKYAFRENIELLGAIGHYTQNNYEIAALALSNSLKPEKVWHTSLGAEVRIVPWLTDKVDVFGKYYYDLVSENVTQRRIGADGFPVFMDSTLRARYGNAYIDSVQGTGEFDKLTTAFMLSNELYESHYTNDGSGYSFGFENLLRYDPTAFWYGWLSFSLGTSVRQRHPGWRWHPFELDRPLLISLVNYYRLPRKYEIGVKYRFMSGLPYTPVNNDQGFSIGPSNSRRYAPYQRLDFRISKGFNLFKSRGNFYVEAWNAFNLPNSILRDSKTHEIKMFDINIPITVLFLGMDFSL
jgi:hypothetical protein